MSDTKQARNARDGWVFSYRAQVIEVVDGDTLILRLDRGMRGFREERFRLAKLNCPESGTPEGENARAFTNSWIADACDKWGSNVSEWPLMVVTKKTDDYGRWVASVIRRCDERCLNDDLLSSGNAVPWPKVK